MEQLAGSSKQKCFSTDFLALSDDGLGPDNDKLRKKVTRAGLLALVTWRHTVSPNIPLRPNQLNPNATFMFQRVLLIFDIEAETLVDHALSETSGEP
jgi:hypothetical protein